MSRFHRQTMIAVTVWAVSFATTASLEAQRRGFFPRERVNGAHLLRISDVQKELKLNDIQKTKLHEIRKQVFGNFHEAFAGLNHDERHKKFKQLNDEALRRSNAELDKYQQKRLLEITRQIRGSAAFEDDAQVVKKLKLTDNQIAKIKQIHEQRHQQRKKLTAGLSRKALREKAKELRKDFKELAEATEQQCMAVLTDSQREQWQDLTGKEFKFKFRRK